MSDPYGWDQQPANPYSSQPTMSQGEYNPNPDERQWGMFAGLGTFLLGWIGLLIVHLMKSKESRFVKHHVKELLFLYLTILGVQLGLVIVFGLIIVALIALGAPDALAWGLGAIGYLALFVIGIWALVITIKDCIAAYRGEWYRMPYIYRFGH